jgi:hypothetical protein
MQVRNNFLPGDKVKIRREAIPNKDLQAFPHGVILRLNGENAIIRLAYVGDIITVPQSSLSLSKRDKDSG